MEGSLESGSPSTVKESSLEEISAALSGSSYDIQQPVNTGKVSLPDVFHVDTSLIPHAHLDEQVSDELRRLELNVYNQEDFEQNVMAQVDKAIEKEEEEKRKRILTKELKNVDDEIKVVKQELDQINKVVTVMESQRFTETKVLMRRAQAVRSKRDNKLKQLKKLKAKQKALNIHLYGYSENLDADDELLHEENQALSSLDQALNFGQEKKETEEQKMIRTGEMTPFGTVMDFNAMKPKTIVQPSTSQLSEFEQFLIDKDNNKLAKLEKQRERKKLDDKTFEKSAEKRGKRVLAFKTHSLEPTATSSKVDNKNKSGKRNLFDARDYRVYNRETDFSSSGFQGKTRYCPQIQHNFQGDPVLNHGAEFSDDDEWIPAAGTTFNPDDLQPNVDEDAIIKARIHPDSWQLKKSVKGSVHEADDITNDDEFLKTGKCRLNCKSSLKRLRDDGNLRNYQKRIKLFNSKNAKRKLEQLEKGENSEEDVEFDGGLKVPGHMWTKLYKYQRTGVRWLWELHCQQAGGIIGDEMGLGKTIQTITFFASLSQSKLKSSLFSYVGLGPTIIVCPATVMHQWVREFHTWWPLFRVSILHSSGSFSGTDKQLIGSIVNCSGILITSYSTLVMHQDNIIHHKWHYVVLDEGHKIRNPNAQITVCCKQFRTPHRIILSGTPIQNNLKELWSLFDFVFPGKLGMLPDFMEHFSVPIVQGGYSNASQVQVQTAYKCACILRDTISPYLLRRMKSDVKVNLDLPNKNEQVLFCRLTHEQKDVYQEYLDSRECQAILNGQFKVFAGLITLRKICNHPDLSTGGPRIYTDKSVNEDEMFEYGFWKRSGKLIVVEALLRLWKQQGHRALLFSQSRAMLNIFEIFLKRRSYKYMKMDGTTSVSSRQPLINKFNSDPTIDLFLLTTRVGGLGVNLIGANRVIIFDPDWNPSTDTQARERAWRIGQTKQVTIYRLLTTGTIEEKIYHRQIFKQFLSNKVLKDPKQRRFFKSNELYELFTLGSSDKNQQTETSALFAGIGSDVCFKPKSKNRFDLMKEKRRLVSKDLYELDEEEKDKMRRFARELSKKIEREKNERLCNISQSSTVKSIDGVGNGLLGDSTVSEHHKKGKDSKPQKMSATMKFMGKKHSKCKSKKKQYKDAYFEGERIPNLVKQQEYKTPAGKREEDHSTFMDDYILKKLFKKSGVHSALKHDAVMNSSLPDFLLVEAEAEKIAKEAAKALKHSRSQCLNAMSGVPTWTGQISGKVAKPRFGQKKNSLLLNNQHSVKTLIPEDLSSGSPGSSTKESQTRLKHFDGKVSGNSLTSKTENLNTTMSSNELLARMRTRSLISNDDNHETKVNICGADVDLITNIRNYIAFQCSVDGKATTQELLDKYKTQLPPSDSAKFRSMLNQICDFDKIDGIGTWFLKLEFR